MNYGIFINAFYVYIIIKMSALLVLSVNNRYIELLRASIRYDNSIRYGNNKERGKTLTGCRFQAQVSFNYLGR